jgi:serine-type D-Ala-D-Ala carboxypeptidase (penicillin-binding protein 5/6)
MIIVASIFVTAPFTAWAVTPVAPALAAEAYVLKDLNSDQVLVAQNADERREPASLTKLMSAYLTFQALKTGKIKMDQTTSVSLHAHKQEGSRTFLEANESVTVQTLLYGMIVQSGNDATVALSELISGNEPTFVQLMNETAKKLGMLNTHFQNAPGLNHPEHYSTASDMARLAAAIIHDFPEYYPIYSVKSFTHHKITQPNRNLLLYRDPTVDGMKTGHTEKAGYCLVASAKRSNRRLVSVVMGTRSDIARAQESLKLLNFGFGAYETTQVAAAEQRLPQIATVYKGALSTAYAGVQQDVWMTLPNGDARNISKQVQFNAPLIAPLKKGAEIGRMTLSLNGKPLQTVPVVTLEEIKEGSFMKRIKDSIVLMIEQRSGTH